MKKDIHASYMETKVKCTTCGQEINIKSTVETLNIESCNKCHPAYTGKSKSGNAAGRVEKFNKKFGV